jgi:hypothetical protein
MPATTRLAGPRPGAPISAYSIKRALRATLAAADQIDDWIRRHVIDRPPDPQTTGFSTDHPRPAPRQAPTPRPPVSPVSVFHPVRRPRTNPPPSGMVVLVRDRKVWLSAIGRTLKAQYDVVATPMPRRLALLVERLEAQERPRMG